MNNKNNNMDGNNAPLKDQKTKTRLIRTLLISAALSTAIVSIITTAKGLDLYIFKGNWFFAGIISAAIQGVLVTLSVSAMSIIHSARSIWGKLLVIIVWGCFLITSSIFSFIYVSKTAYPDNVMHEDAEQSMALFVQEQSYFILEKAEILDNYYAEQLGAYINILNNNNNGGVGYTIDPIHKEYFQNEIEDLNRFNNEYSENVERYVFAASDFIKYITKISSGSHTKNDITIYKKALDDRIKLVEEKISYYYERYDNAVIEIVNLNTRLNSFTSLWSREYQLTFENREREIEKRDEADRIRHYMQDYLGVLGSCKTFIEEFEGGTESVIYNNTILLRSELNAELIDTQKLTEISEGIYNELIKSNVSVNDPRIIGYMDFKTNLKSYNGVIMCKQSIERELEKIESHRIAYSADNNTVTETVSDEFVSQQNGLADVSDAESVRKQEPTANVSVDKQEVAISQNILEGSDDVELEHNVSENKEWRIFWSQRLTNLLSEVSLLPLAITTDNRGITADDKSNMLEEVSERRRLYLTELNDFDRAISLLKEHLFGFHKHGLMIVVSLLFSFGIDLFSLASGSLIYFFRPKKSPMHNSRS